MSIFHYVDQSGRWYKPWSIAWLISSRYWIALVWPFWDGDSPGRAYTPHERQLVIERQNASIYTHPADFTDYPEGWNRTDM